MFLEKLESGFLLFETKQGLVRIDLSLGQRIYLLWTFRNFRQLSVPLLNPRQRALVNSLFSASTGVLSQEDDRLPVIGVVERFVPPVPVDFPSGEFPSNVRLDTRSVVSTIDASTAERPSLKKQRREKLALPLGEIALKHSPASSPLAKDASSNVATTEVAMRVARARVATSRFATTKLATAAAALCLCFVSVAAWHRIEGIPASEAHNLPQVEPIETVERIEQPNPPQYPPQTAEAPVAIAENSADIAQPADAMSVVVPEPVSGPAVVSAASASVVVSDKKVAPEAAVESASISAAAPTLVPAPIPNPEPAIRAHAVATHGPLPAPSGEASGIQASRPPLHFVYPDYPDIHARGVVSLTARVDSGGAVRTVRVVSGNQALAAAAVRAVRQWHYRPYLKDGQPVATETNIVISFISSDAISMTFPPTIPVK